MSPGDTGNVLGIGWPNGTVVYVNSVTNTHGTPTAAEINAVTAGIGAWGWGVTTTATQGLSTATVNVQLSDPTVPAEWNAKCVATANACTTPALGAGGSITGGTVRININNGDINYPDLMMHEVGHVYGISDCVTGAGAGCNAGTGDDGGPGYVTAMDPNTNAFYTAPTGCDGEVLYNANGFQGSQSCYGDDFANAEDNCDGAGWCLLYTNCAADEDECQAGCCSGDDGGGGGGGGGGGEGDCDDNDSSCNFDTDCCSGNCDDGYCESLDPIIIDLTGLGYQLTSPANGVKFDFFGTGTPIQMSWTAAGWNGGFLALDRNGNGKIDNGTELFTNVTPQPAATGKGNGFLALAVYDQPANGGNGDGWIDKQDAIFSKLLVWVDKNHNGIADRGELLTMAQAGIQAISLSYSPANWTDAFGNTFRYGSQMRTNASTHQVVYDVLLHEAQTGGTK